MVTHYVTAHSCRPPQPFLDALLAVDLDAWGHTVARRPLSLGPG
ncbi:hypothetical protein [Streptomyces sp. NPDC002104]